MIRPIPIQRYLVPEARSPLLENFALIDRKLVQGLPHRIQLDAEFTLILIAPTGLAIIWRDLDPATLVSSQQTETVAYDPAAATTDALPEAPHRLPVRLLVQRARGILASIPLTAGMRRIVPESATGGGSQIELIIQRWQIFAGNLRGVGDFGSRISLAWRRVDRGTNQFSSPPLASALSQRLPPLLQTDSADLTSEHSTRLRGGN